MPHKGSYATAGLSIALPSAKGYAEAPPYEDQTVINNYYAEEDPPVTTVIRQARVTHQRFCKFRFLSI